jgi:hypothetical protein
MGLGSIPSGRTTMSASKKFKAERDIKYLNIINEIIKKKLIK